MPSHKKSPIPASTGISKPSSTDRRRRLTAVFLILAALALLIYGDALRAPFYFDDLTIIIENPHIRMTRPDISQIRETAVGQPTGRAFPVFTFALNYLFHQDLPAGYRLVNIFIHVACGFLVFLLTFRTLCLCGHEKPLVIALAAGLLWLFHPLHTQSVTYIVQRINSLAALFFLASLWFYIEARLAWKQEPRRHMSSSWPVPAAAAVICGLLALSSKQNTAMLPLILFLYEWFFLRQSDSGKKPAAGLLPAAVLAAATIIMTAFVYLGSDPVGKISAAYDSQPFTPDQRLLTQPLVIIYYISLLAFPHPARLNLDYDFPPAPTRTDPIMVLTALVALGALLTAACLVKRNRLPAFAVLWFLTSLIIESSFIGLALIFEHRTYLPSVFPVIALTACLFQRIRPVPAAVILLSIMIAVSGLWTRQRNIVWQDPLTFWRDCTLKAPENKRAHNNYGMALKDVGDYARAAEAYRQAISLARGGKAAPHNNLGMLYFHLNDPEKAARQFQKAIQAEPGFFKAYLNLGSLMTLTGNSDQALTYLEEARRLNPWDPAVHVALGKACFETGRIEEAINHCRRALELNPRDISAQNNLGAILLAVGAPDKALPHLASAVRQAPDHAEANINLGLAHDRLGNMPPALLYLRRAVFLAPEHAGARAELGLFLLRAGRISTAQEHLEKALDIKPDLLKARLALADLFLETGRTDRAGEQYRAVLDFDPGNETARRRLRALEQAVHDPD